MKPPLIISFDEGEIRTLMAQGDSEELNPGDPRKVIIGRELYVLEEDGRYYHLSQRIKYGMRKCAE